MTNQSDFNPLQQQQHMSSKIVAGLERISEVFKVLLWEKAKLVGLSPIQIQILIFIHFHKQALSNVSHLAKEFNVTKPTISDAVKVLENKGLIIKEPSSTDSRRYTIVLSNAGQHIVAETSNFTEVLKTQLDGFESEALNNLFETLSTLIYKLNRSGILNTQRICFGCRFYEKNKTGDYCNLLQKELQGSDIRIDCPEFESK